MVGKSPWISGVQGSSLLVCWVSRVKNDQNTETRILAKVGPKSVKPTVGQKPDKELARVVWPKSAITFPSGGEIVPTPLGQKGGGVRWRRGGEGGGKVVPQIGLA